MKLFVYIEYCELLIWSESWHKLLIEGNMWCICLLTSAILKLMLEFILKINTSLSLLLLIRQAAYPFDT